MLFETVVIWTLVCSITLYIYIYIYLVNMLIIWIGHLKTKMVKFRQKIFRSNTQRWHKNIVWLFSQKDYSWLKIMVCFRLTRRMVDYVFVRLCIFDKTGCTYWGCRCVLLCFFREPLNDPEFIRCQDRSGTDKLSLTDFCLYNWSPHSILIPPLDCLYVLSGIPLSSYRQKGWR